MGFPRQEYWNGLPFPSPADLPNSGIRPTSLVLAGGFFSTEPPGKPGALQSMGPQSQTNEVNSNELAAPANCSLSSCKQAILTRLILRLTLMAQHTVEIQVVASIIILNPRQRTNALGRNIIV